MIEAAAIGGLFVLVDAADSSAIEIAQRQHILQCGHEGGAVLPLQPDTAGIAPEIAKAHDHGQHGIKRDGAEQAGHDIMRHQPVEAAVGGE
ncbi:hypothetical protein D3C87_1941590 [compost metagenome]